MRGLYASCKLKPNDTFEKRDMPRSTSTQGDKGKEEQELWRAISYSTNKMGQMTC